MEMKASVNVTWNVEGEQELKALWQKALTALAESTVERAVESAPGQTYNMRRSIMWRMTGSKTARVFTTSGYGAYVEMGTGLYGPKNRRITPKVKKFLSWLDRKTGKRIFARSVRGSRPQPFMRPAIEWVRDNVRDVLSGVR